MEEKMVIIVPEETDEFKKQRNDFKLTLELSVFATFWGLFMMKLPIPEDIWNFVYNNKDNLPNNEIKMAFSILAGAPIEKDPYVRQMVLGEVV